MSASPKTRVRHDDIPLNLWYRAAVKLIESIPDADRRADLRMTFEERAAICEYDGKLTRPEAERLAFREIRQLVGGVNLTARIHWDLRNDREDKP